VAVITFSREAHSGTQDLARLLADRLGYGYVGRDELTRAVAARSGVERQPQSLETEGRSLSRLQQLGEHLTGEREAYVAALRAVVTELALADDVVIVGHGAGHFLADLRTVVRIFVVAPVADRVARLQAEQPELDASRARQLIEGEDRESAEYLRYLFGIDWLDPHQWDLVINTGRVNPQVALDMLVSYTRSLVRDRAEAADLQRQDLANRLEQALIKDDHGIDHLRIHFESNTLILEGEALTVEDRERTEATARALAAETALLNQIVVRPPSSA
jgi:cytidylate kinase